jgi:hypothetical protein
MKVGWERKRVAWKIIRLVADDELEDLFGVFVAFDGELGQEGFGFADLAFATDTFVVVPCDNHLGIIIAPLGGTEIEVMGALEIDGMKTFVFVVVSQQKRRFAVMVVFYCVKQERNSFGVIVRVIIVEIGDSDKKLVIDRCIQKNHSYEKDE